jgi:hypothetical protein
MENGEGLKFEIQGFKFYVRSSMFKVLSFMFRDRTKPKTQNPEPVLV